MSLSQPSGDEWLQSLLNEYADIRDVLHVSRQTASLDCYTNPYAPSSSHLTRALATSESWTASSRLAFEWSSYIWQSEKKSRE